MLCLGFEPGWQGGRHWRIHWAMAAPRPDHSLHRIKITCSSSESPWTYKKTLKSLPRISKHLEHGFDSSLTTTQQIKRVRWIVYIVTRFGKISPLWRNFINLWPFIEGLDSIWKHFEHLLANYWCFWANANCYKWPNIKHIIKPSGHPNRAAI